MNDGGDCRTAPATQGLLIILYLKDCPLFVRVYVLNSNTTIYLIGHGIKEFDEITCWDFCSCVRQFSYINRMGQNSL